MIKIHPTAVVSPNAKIGDETEIGPYCVIDDDVVIGEGNKLIDSVRIYSHSRIGNNNIFRKGASIGNIPQILNFNSEETELIVGNNNIFNEYTIVHRGSLSLRKTIVGDNCELEDFSHIAHDCIIENNVHISMYVQLAGHVHIEEHTFIGDITAIHQFTHIGKYVNLEKFAPVGMDILPYSKFGGDPFLCKGANSEYLKKSGFPENSIKALEVFYNYFTDPKYNTSQAIELVTAAGYHTEELNYIFNFIKNSKRGILK